MIKSIDNNLVNNLVNDNSVIAIGKRLRILRTLTGLNRNEFAKLATLTPTTISYWENGSTGEISPKSMAKLMAIFKTLNIVCTEEWLQEGIGGQPTFSQKPNSFMTRHIPNLDLNQFKFSEELKLFISSEQHHEGPIITRINHKGLSPLYQKNDVVGGVLYKINQINFSEEQICIIKLDNMITVRRIKPSKKSPSHFNLSYISYDSACEDSLQLDNIKLEMAAPILRVWR